MHELDLRISDLDRDNAAQLLHRSVGEGRISWTEHEERLTGVYAARTRSDLLQLLADLPPVDPEGPATSSWSRQPPLQVMLSKVVRRPEPGAGPQRINVTLGASSWTCGTCRAAAGSTSSPTPPWARSRSTCRPTPGWSTWAPPGWASAPRWMGLTDRCRCNDSPPTRRSSGSAGIRCWGTCGSRSPDRAVSATWRSTPDADRCSADRNRADAG